MQLADLKRPRFYIPIGLLLVLTVLSAVVFNPGFQKKMLLKHGGPLVDSLQLDYVHFTPAGAREAAAILTANAILSHQDFPAIATVEEDAEAMMIPADIFRDWVRRYE